jgi:anaerobic magnesium-protoporphyrin IX monomethyl ester cyclase
LVYRKNGAIVDTGQGEFIEDLDEIPFPAFHLLDMEIYFANPRYHTTMNIHKRAMPMMTSRGCPFHCSFCFHILGYKYRPRSAKNVLDEIDFLVQKYGLRELHIEDDTFNFDPNRAKAIMRGIIERGYKLAIIFTSGIRGDMVDEELMDLFTKAGVYRISFGIETATPRMQKLIHKSLDFKKLENTIDMASHAGISTNGFFIIGFPTETEEEIMTTINYALKSKLSTAVFSVLKMFPGSDLADKYLKEVPDFDDDMTFSYDAPTMPNHSMVTDERLLALRRRANIRFFFSLSRILRIFRTSPNKIKLFTKNIQTVLSLIFKGSAKY